MTTASNQARDKAITNAAAVNTVTSEELLGAAKQLLILHNGDNYTLRITANNKLLLTK